MEVIEASTRPSSDSEEWQISGVSNLNLIHLDSVYYHHKWFTTTVHHPHNHLIGHASVRAGSISPCSMVTAVAT